MLECQEVRSDNRRRTLYRSHDARVGCGCAKQANFRNRLILPYCLNCDFLTEVVRSIAQYCTPRHLETTLVFEISSNFLSGKILCEIGRRRIRSERNYFRGTGNCELGRFERFSIAHQQQKKLSINRYSPVSKFVIRAQECESMIFDAPLRADSCIMNVGNRACYRGFGMPC